MNVFAVVFAFAAIILAASLAAGTVNLSGNICPPGQLMRYSFTGYGFVEAGCQDIAPDAGDVCTSGSECTYGCVLASEDDLATLGCGELLCGQTVSCPGIRGKCLAITQEGGSFINQPGTVYKFCPD